MAQPSVDESSVINVPTTRGVDEGMCWDGRLMKVVPCRSPDPTALGSGRDDEQLRFPTLQSLGDDVEIIATHIVSSEAPRQNPQVCGFDEIANTFAITTCTTVEGNFDAKVQCLSHARSGGIFVSAVDVEKTCVL